MLRWIYSKRIFEVTKHKAALTIIGKQNRMFKNTTVPWQLTKSLEDLWQNPKATSNITEKYVHPIRSVQSHTKRSQPLHNRSTQNKETKATHNSQNQFTTIFNLQSKFPRTVHPTLELRTHLVYDHSLTDCSHLFPISSCFCLFYKQTATITLAQNLQQFQWKMLLRTELQGPISKWLDVVLLFMLKLKFCACNCVGWKVVQICLIV